MIATNSNKPVPSPDALRAIRVFLVDDHQVLLEGLARLINDNPTMKVIGTARDGRTAIKQIQLHRPDVVLLDISMPNLNGLEAARQICDVSPNTKIVILSMHENEEFLKRSLRAGAVGYLLKDATAEELFTAIKETHEGNSYLSPCLSRTLIAEYIGTAEGTPRHSEKQALTPREREVLQLLAEGHSNQSISDSLHLSAKTVATHRKKIMKKLQLHSIPDLVRYAIRNGITSS